MELKYWSYILFLCFWATKIETAKILAIFPLPLPSHYIFIRPLLEKLADKGHELTIFGLYPPEKSLPNFRHIMVESNRYIIQDILDTVAKCENSILDETKWLKIMPESTKNLLDHPELQKLMANPQGKFDLIIEETLWPSALSGLGEHFNAPMIAVSPYGVTPLTGECVGNISPWSIIPHEVVPYDTRMNFLQRFHTFLISAATAIGVYFFNTNPQKEFYKEYFPSAKTPYEVATSSYSLLLVNQHHTLSYPRPYLTNVIEVAGLHIPKNPPALPSDMQEFLDGAAHGVIYFSLGSNIKAKDLPIERRNVFLNVFRGLKQRVLWKFEDTNLANKSDNVFISSWCPQHAVLKHPNVKVFITHGGLLSTTEAIFYGKPMLGFPMFAEQPRNIAKAQSRGIALKMSFSRVTEKELKHGLEELLYNPTYKANIAEISRQFTDKPMNSLDTAEFWVEYVLRHNGAKHIQSPVIHLNTLQYHSVDVILVLILAVTIFIYMTKIIIKTLIRSLVSLKHAADNVVKTNKKFTHYSH